MEKAAKVRVCYENGNPKTGKKVYELTKLCHCSDCLQRNRYQKGTLNQATATTSDVSKIDMVAEYLEAWRCKKKEASKTEYLEF